MFFIPYGNVKIKTQLSCEDIERRIKEQLVSHPSGFRLPNTTYKYFMGNVGNAQFKLHRFSWRGNFLKPVFIGKIHQRRGVSIIDITLRPDSVTLGFLLLFLLGNILPIVIIPLMPLFTPASSEYLQYIQSQPISDHIQLALMMLRIGITAFSSLYLFIIIPFNIEARRVLKHLNNSLGTENPVNLSRSK